MKVLRSSLFAGGLLLVLLGLAEPALAYNNADVWPGSSSVPSSIAPGETKQVRIRVYNNGSTTWWPSTAHRLGADYERNQVTWSGFSCGGYAVSPTNSRAYLCGGVGAGGYADFTFNITAPAGASGSVRLAVWMVQDGVQWFGERYEWWIPVSGGSNNADVWPGSSSVPSSIAPGETKQVRVRVYNNGSTTWSAGALHRLGADYERNQVTWSGFSCGGYNGGPTNSRAYLCGSVSPGGYTDFTFNITAPAGASGSVKLAVWMVQDGVQWFGERYEWSIPVSGGGSGLVTRSGAGLVRGGSTYKYAGVNLRGIAHRSSGDIQTQLQEASNMNATVIRVFIAQNGTSATTITQRLWNLINTARSIDSRLKFVVTLTDFYNTGLYPDGDASWYAPNAGGFNVHKADWYRYGFRNNYKPFVAVLVTELQSVPEILAWELGNELSAASADDMLNFVYEMGNYIKGLGAQQMVTTGFISSHHASGGNYSGRSLTTIIDDFYYYWSGWSGSNDFSPIDLMSVHGYGHGTGAVDWAPGAPNKVSDDLDWGLSRIPVMVGEIGFSGAFTSTAYCTVFDGEWWDGIWLPDATNSRYYAVQRSVDHFYDLGTDGVLHWGFMAGGYDNGEGDKCFGIDQVWHKDWTDLFNYFSATGSSLPGQ